jgi:hypothetical protein
MTTFAIKTIDAVKELSTQDQTVIHEALVDAVQHDLFISIQGEVYDWGGGDDGEEVMLYGVYTMTAEEVMDYYSNGGLWEYYYPRELLNQLVTA